MAPGIVPTEFLTYRMKQAGEVFRRRAEFIFLRRLERVKNTVGLIFCSLPSVGDLIEMDCFAGSGSGGL